VKASDIPSSFSLGRNLTAHDAVGVIDEVNQEVVLTFRVGGRAVGEIRFPQVVFNQVSWDALQSLIGEACRRDMAAMYQGGEH
jgi:hypothetical protein